VESKLLAFCHRNAPFPPSEKLNLKEIDYILMDSSEVCYNGRVITTQIQCTLSVVWDVFDMYVYKIYPRQWAMPVIRISSFPSNCTFTLTPHTGSDLTPWHIYRHMTIIHFYYVVRIKKEKHNFLLLFLRDKWTFKDKVNYSRVSRLLLAMYYSSCHELLAMKHKWSFIMALKKKFPLIMVEFGHHPLRA
jgi:hypothetical protein